MIASNVTMLKPVKSIDKVINPLSDSVKLSAKYLQHYENAKQILNASTIDNQKFIIFINNNKHLCLSNIEKATIIRVVNFTNKGNKLIVFNNNIIYIPDYEKQNNQNKFMAELNSYILNTKNYLSVHGIINKFL